MSSTEIVFDSFEDVLNYRKACPVCKGLIKFDPATGMKHQQLITDEFGQHIFQDNSIGISLSADLTNKKIIKVSSIALYGTYYTGLKFKCSNCPEYYYFVKIEFDLGKNIVNSISLNSETVYWFKDNKSIKIQISYIYKEIVVTTDIANFHEGTFKLPIIDLNLSDRNQMMETIGKYAAFL